MRANSREDFTYLEIYRPVVAGMEKFQDKMRYYGDQVFGHAVNTVVDEPDIDEITRQSIIRTRGVEVPVLDVYGNSRLRLNLIDRRVEPRLNYASRFRWVAGRLIRNPEEVAFSPIERTPEVERRRSVRRRRDSLAFIFEQVGLKYDVTDQSELELSFNGLDFSVDPPLDHTGLEVCLVPDPQSEITRMLVEQAGVCLRGLARHSPKAANPYSPTALRIPFARLPADATQQQVSHFMKSAHDNLPVRAVLGSFKDNVGSPSWSKVKR